jgi:hypothetical protein
MAKKSRSEDRLARSVRRMKARMHGVIETIRHDANPDAPPVVASRA